MYSVHVTYANNTSPPFWVLREVVPWKQRRFGIKTPVVALQDCVDCQNVRRFETKNQALQHLRSGHFPDDWEPSAFDAKYLIRPIGGKVNAHRYRMSVGKLNFCNDILFEAYKTILRIGHGVRNPDNTHNRRFRLCPSLVLSFSSTVRFLLDMPFILDKLASADTLDEAMKHNTDSHKHMNAWRDISKVQLEKAKQELLDMLQEDVKNVAQRSQVVGPQYVPHAT